MAWRREREVGRQGGGRTTERTRCPPLADTAPPHCAVVKRIADPLSATQDPRRPPGLPRAQRPRGLSTLLRGVLPYHDEPGQQPLWADAAVSVRSVDAIIRLSQPDTPRQAARARPPLLVRLGHHTSSTERQRRIGRHRLLSLHGAHQTTTAYQVRLLALAQLRRSPLAQLIPLQNTPLRCSGGSRVRCGSRSRRSATQSCCRVSGGRLRRAARETADRKQTQRSPRTKRTRRRRGHFRCSCRRRT